VILVFVQVKAVIKQTHYEAVISAIHPIITHYRNAMQPADSSSSSSSQSEQILREFAINDECLASLSCLESVLNLLA
jgi:hypothetical protein